MADTTVTANPDTNAGHKGHDIAEFGHQQNKAPADQAGFDPKDAKWAGLPGAAARGNGFPRNS